jgi:hypothetical protein
MPAAAARPPCYHHAVPLMVAILVSFTLIVTDAAWYKGHYLNQLARLLRTLI